MSELKSYNSERIYWAVEQHEREAGDIEDLHLDDNLYYIKSEVDKVIAELEMQLERAKLVLRLNEPKALYSNLDTMSRLNHKIYVVERRELHQKYKRCLTMAQWCDAEADVADADGDYDDMRWYQKWHYRWLDLAVKFKEVK